MKSFPFWLTVTCLSAAGIWYGGRAVYLNSPPSSVAVAVAESLDTHPEQWEVGSMNLTLVNDGKNIRIRRYDGEGSLQVFINEAPAPTLDQAFNLFSSNNQNYVNKAVKRWQVKTETRRRAEAVASVRFEP